MNRLILFLFALCFSLTGFAQPILRNSLNTNTLGTNLVWSPGDNFLTLNGTLANSGAISITSNGFTVVSISPPPGGNLLPALTVSSLTANTVVSANAGKTLTSIANGVGVLTNNGSGGLGFSTNVTQEVTYNSVVFNVGQGGKLTITTNLIIQTNAALVLSNLAAPSVIVLGTNRNVTNATLSGLTLSDANVLTASGGGDTTWSNIVTLTQTGTNVSAMDYALVAGGGLFKLQLTNTAYIGAPSGVASTPFSKAWLIVQQPATGTCFLTFTNGFYQFPEGVAPIIDTNNGATTIFQFVSDPITNGLLHGWMSLKSKLIP